MTANMVDDRREMRSITPSHHALLFAYLAREVIDQLGERRGAQVLEAAIWRYGIERGKRMALRAVADGRELSFRTYLTYAEWRHAQELARIPSRVETLATSPDLHRHVMTCPWHEAWRDAGLLSYGRHYCRHIDRALVRGFDAGLVLQVGETLSGGGTRCDFSFRKADLSSEDLAAITAESLELAPRTVMPWGYHLGHLYKTMGESIAAETGAMGELLVSDGFKAFTGRFPEAARIAASHLSTDFSVVTPP